MDLKYLIEKPETNIINQDFLNETRIMPQINKNISYIVGVILLNDKNQICLIQEAKVSCYKKWYLPAGRVEPNENLNQAVIREAGEETGYAILPLGLICVELSELANWIRFTFIAQIVGGSLKKIPDSESLCANWFHLDQFKDNNFLANLRANDFIKLVHLGVQTYNYYGFDSMSQIPETDFIQLKTKFNIILPNAISQKVVIFGFVILNESFSKCLLYQPDQTASLLIPSVFVTPFIFAKLNLNCLDYAVKNILFPHCFKSDKLVNFKKIGVSGVNFLSENLQHGIQMLFVLNISNECDYDTNASYKWVKLNKSYDYFKNEHYLIKLLLNS